MKKTGIVLLIAATAAFPAWGQGIVIDGRIETGGQLISSAPVGIEPLVVSSTTKVRGLNADRIDGMEAADFALDVDLQNAEVMLVSLQAQVDGLGLAPVRRSGQMNCYAENGNLIACGSGAGAGQDGHTQLGVTWPAPRFTNNGDGTVTDHLTGLIWLENANCSSSRLDHVDAIAFARTLFDGSTDHGGGDCGLTDGSLAGEWRLPNVMELQSLMHYGFDSPALPDTIGSGQWAEGDPFTNVPNDFFWSSTSFESLPSMAWLLNLSYGSVRYASKPGLWRVWPVRGGR